MIDENALRKIMPGCINPVKWVQPLETAMQRFQIGTIPRAAAFLGQIAHESGQLNHLVENLNYSATRLVQVWPKRFPTLAAAMPYANNAERLANNVYAQRLGNGDEVSGDGWRYRGRGLIQVTGRGNYRNLAVALGLPLENNPELLEQPEGAALSAAQFWQAHGLNELADDQNDDNDEQDFVTITIRINGGTAGLDERRHFWSTAKNVLGG